MRVEVIEDFDTKPPAAFGDAALNELGVRDGRGWYLHDHTGTGCAHGNLGSDVAT